MRPDYWQLGTWGRIPVSMHWTVLLSFAWLYLIFFDVLSMLFGAVALAVLFVAHEYGHVFMLRRRKIAVTGIALWGIHGETSYNEYAAKPGDAVAVAWGGVAAQLLVLLVALAVAALVPFAAIPFGERAWAPMYLVFTRINIFLMIIALLPIGPFDGHAAWQVIGRTRARFKKQQRKAKPPPSARPVPAEPEVQLSEEERRELDKRSGEEAANLIAKLTRRSDANAGDDTKK